MGLLRTAERIKMDGKKKKLTFDIKPWRIITAFLMIYDAITVNASYFLALLIRHDLRFSMIDHIYIVYWRSFAPYYTVEKLEHFAWR